MMYTIRPEKQIVIPLQWSNLCYLPVRQILNSSTIWRSYFFSQSAKINPFQGWAVNFVAPALMHCGCTSEGYKMGPFENQSVERDLY